MNQSYFLQQLYKTYISKKSSLKLKNSQIFDRLETLSKDRKTELAYKFLHQAEVLLLKGNLIATKYFDAAERLDSASPYLWHKEGLAYFEYGNKTKKINFLHLSSKKFKVATNLDPLKLEFWWSWSFTLLSIGKFKSDINYIIESRKKIEKAISLTNEETSKEILSELYWDYGLIWSEIAALSEEAVDIRSAIDAFHKSFTNQTKISPEFWYDFGNAYMQMALLTNEQSTYLVAIDYLNKAIRAQNDYINANIALANCYTQLYINTVDENYFNNANTFYKKINELRPNNSELLLEWAQLLHESAYLNNDISKLKNSIKISLQADRCSNKDPYVLTQLIESQALLGSYVNRLDLLIDSENKIIKLTDKYPDITELWYTYGMVMRAFSVYYNDSDYEDYAIEKFNLGLLHDASNAEIYFELAKSYKNMGVNLEDTELLIEAKKYFEKAKDLKTASPMIIYEYGKTLLDIAKLTDDQETTTQALIQFEYILQHQKESILQRPGWLFYYGQALDRLGDCHENENYYLKAIEAFHSVLLIDPDYKDVYLNLGLAFSHLGELSMESKYFIKSINYFKLAANQEEENDVIWLEWGTSLIYLAQAMVDNISANQYYMEAKQKLVKAGQLGNLDSYYTLACLFALTNNPQEAVHFLSKAHKQEVLPPCEELLQDEWLENLHSTELFSQFLSEIETKQKLSFDDY
jgi:tetratricopeptide (TPR) repeat protein